MPAREPTERERLLVKTMATAGIAQETIALCLEVGVQALRRQFRRELDTGLAFANAKVSQTLYLAATNAIRTEERQEVDERGNVRTVQKVVGFSREGLVAAIFWMKTRGGWKYAADQDDERRPEGPTLDLAGMSEERKLLLLDLLQEAAAGPEAPMAAGRGLPAPDALAAYDADADLSAEGQG